MEYNYYRWKGWRGFSKRIDRTKLSIDKVKINANSNLSLRLILKFEQKYKHLDGYIEYAHLLLCQLNIV